MNLCRTVFTLAFSLGIAWVASVGHAADPANFQRWEPSIKAFEAQDEKSPPSPGGTLFIGSSSIRLWDLERDFPGKGYVNRGFGGSEIADSVHFFDRIVLPHRPKTIVMYAGDNDIAKGKTPATVAEDFRQFVALVREELPGSRVIFIGIKPSGKRWSMVAKIREANQLIQEFAANAEDVMFVDVFPPMLGEDGLPRREYFVADQLHMSPAGYEVWTKLVNQALMAD